MTSGLTDGMTLEQQIGQLLMVGFPGTRAPADLLDLITTEHIGCVIFFSRNIATAQQTLELTRSLQAAAHSAHHSYPLLIAIDQENGIVRRTGGVTTAFPGNMALGALGSAETTAAVAQATGEELRALGITMNLAPVMDVASNPDNPVIGVRSFGADPALVARMGVTAMHGYQAAGVVATLKHFPGHGDTATDSHHALPVLPFDDERLERVELVPFRAGIAAGAVAVMTAHVALPAITGSAEIPATLSSDVLQGLLRQRLGFEGVILTDCLEMDAISKDVGVGPGAVAALRAGADIVLVSHRIDRQRAALAAIRAAVESGELTPERIQVSAERVLRLKQRLPSWDDLPTDAALDGLRTGEHRRVAEDVYARSITVIRDEAGLVPLRRTPVRRILAVTPPQPRHSPAVDQGFALADFVAALRRHLAGSADDVRVWENGSAENLSGLGETAGQADIALLVTCNAHQPANIAQARAIVQTLLDAGRPVIGVAVGNPYDANALPEIGTWLASYDFTPPALDAATRVLAGE